MKSFQGITALITGASSGIGEEFACQLAQAGAHLVLVARSKDKLEELAAHLRKQHPIKTWVVVSDLSQEQAPYEIFDAVKKQGIQVDLLVNNAGFGWRGNFEGMSAKDSQAMLTVNGTSLVVLTRLFLPEMFERHQGGIINVDSTAGFQPVPYLAVYAATKALVLSFTEALWGECRGRGVRVFCLCPGNTRTEFHQRAHVEPRQVFWSAQARDVVRFGLNVFKTTNKPTAVYGFLNRLLTQGYRFSPRSLLLRIAGILYRPNQ